MRAHGSSAGRPSLRDAGEASEPSSARVVVGRSELAPAKGDRRFADPAWGEQLAVPGLLQGYLAIGDAVEGAVDDARLDWRAEQQLRFDAGQPAGRGGADELSRCPTPQVLKETLDRGGANLVRGGRRFVRDVAKGRLPAMVDTSKFEVGRNLAVTEGSVVLRTDAFELIQYKPRIRSGLRQAAGVHPADDQ